LIVCSYLPFVGQKGRVGSFIVGIAFVVFLLYDIASGASVSHVQICKMATICYTIIKSKHAKATPRWQFISRTRIESCGWEGFTGHSHL